jgi:hypothetical protein
VQQASVVKDSSILAQLFLVLQVLEMVSDLETMVLDRVDLDWVYPSVLDLAVLDSPSVMVMVTPHLVLVSLRDKHSFVTHTYSSKHITWSL